MCSVGHSTCCLACVQYTCTCIYTTRSPDLPLTTQNTPSPSSSLSSSLFLGSYDEVEVTNFTTSWRDGLAFCAILDRHRPDLLSYDDCLGQQPLENIETAFRVAEEELGIIKIVDPEGE